MHFSPPPPSFIEFSFVSWCCVSIIGIILFIMLAEKKKKGLGCCWAVDYCVATMILVSILFFFFWQVGGFS